MTGSAHAKLTGTGTNTITINQVHSAINGTVNKGTVNGVDYDGNVYVDLDYSNATYSNVYGTYNAAVAGSVTLVIRSGTVTGKGTAGSANSTKDIGGGMFNGMVTAGNNGNKTGTVINGGASMTIYGGTFKNYVIGGGFSDTVNDGVKLTIAGGDFQH